jgi:hypothetical protein
MDSQTSRKIIVAGGMAAVLVIGAVTFALLPHHPSSAPQISQAPATVAPTSNVPAAVASTPDAPPAVASTPEAPAAIAQIPDASAAVARKDSVVSKISHTATLAPVELKVASNRHLAKAPTGADTSDGIATPAEPTVDSSEKSAGETPATGVDGVKNVDEVTMPSTASGTTTFAPATSEPAASDTGSLPK